MTAAVRALDLEIVTVVLQLLEHLSWYWPVIIEHRFLFFLLSRFLIGLAFGISLIWIRICVIWMLLLFQLFRQRESCIFLNVFFILSFFSDRHQSRLLFRNLFLCSFSPLWWLNLFWFNIFLMLTLCFVLLILEFNYYRSN